MVIMSKDEELEVLKKHFKYSVDEVYFTSIVLRNNALINPSIGLMEQIDLFRYTTNDMHQGVSILKDLLDEVFKEREARLVLGCNDEMSDNEKKEVLDGIRIDIEKMFNKLKNNVKDIAASKDHNKRRKDYDRLMKGFRVIAQVLKEGNFSPDVIAATIITIRDSSNHCLGNWKHILTGLMIQFEDKIKSMLDNKDMSQKKIAVMNNEEDIIYSTIENAFYNARKYIAEEITSDFIDKYIFKNDLDDIIYEENNIAHYKGICIEYLNNNNYLNVPQIDVEDDFLSEDVKESVVTNFEEYLEKESIDDLIYDRAAVNIMDDIEKNPNKISQLLDWFNSYLDRRNFNEVKKDKELVVDFFSTYITKGVYNEKIRYLAIRELLLDYGFIAIRKLKHKMILSEDRTRQFLAEVDSEEKKRTLMKLEKDPKLFINIASDPMFSYEDIWEDEKIKKIIEGFVGIDEAIVYACEYENVDMVKYLLNNEVSLEVADEEGRTPLIIAYEQRAKDIVECLLKKGANINATDSYGNTMLMLASEKNDMDMVKYLVERGVDVNASSLLEGNTALIVACYKDNTNIAKYLVENGACVNEENRYGGTPLEFACENNNIELMIFLVKNFASILDLRWKENVVKLLNNDLVKECKYTYSVYIQSLIGLNNIDWLKNLLGDLYYESSESPNVTKSVYLSRFLDRYLDEKELNRIELENCVDFMEIAKERLMRLEHPNSHMLEVLDEYIEKIKECISKMNTKNSVPMEGVQHSIVKERSL